MKLKRILATILCFAMVFSTMSFSVLAEETITVDSAEALCTAIADAESGATIELEADIDYGNDIVLIGKSLTINGNGNKIISAANRVVRVTASNVEVTFNNVNVVSTAVRVEQNDIRGISIDAETNGVILTLNNCSVDFTDASACDWAYAVNQSGTASHDNTIRINGGSYEGANVINIWGNNHTVTVDGATLTSLYPDSEYFSGNCIRLEGPQTNATVKNTTFVGDNAVAIEAVDETSTFVEENNTDNTKLYGEETPVVTTVATVNGVAYPDLESAIADAYTYEGNVTVILEDDFIGNIEIKEKVGLYLTLDGAGKTFDGTIKVKALSNTNDNRRTTIENVNFVSEEKVDFITSNETNHYPRLTVQDCSFTGNGEDESVAIRTKSAYGLVIEDCTGTGLHSFLQNTSGVGISISGVEVTDSKGGLALGTAQNVSISGCEIETVGYGIRLDAVLNTSAALENNKVNAYIPVVVRYATATDYDMSFTGDDNAYTASNTDGKWCVIGTEEYEEGKALPEAPVAGVDVVCDEALADGLCGYTSLNGKAVVIPEGTVTFCYTGTDRFWGEATANSENSFVIKLFEGDNQIASASLNNIGGIIDGDVYVTWNIPFAPNTDGHWNVEWAEGYPKYDMNPTAVKLFSDGVKVAENAVRFNAPDDLNKIVAIAEDADGNVKAYTTITAAVAGSNGKINLVRNVEEEISDLNGCELTTSVEGGVTVKNTYGEWLYVEGLNIGKGVTLEGDSFCFDSADNIIEGTLSLNTLYNRYDSKIIVKNGGNIVTSGMIVNRYHEDAETGIYVYGDGDPSTVEISCGNTLGTYSGTLYVEDSMVNCASMWIDYLKDGNGEGDEYARSTPKFVNSTVNLNGDLRFYKDATLTLEGTALIAGKVQVRQDATPVVTMDSNSSIKATTVENLSGAAMNAVLGADGTIRFNRTLSGSGTEEDPYLISTADDLKGFRTNVNSGNNYAGKYVKLAANIDLGYENWVPIGDTLYNTKYAPVDASVVFSGVFDGNGKIISNLKIEKTVSYAPDATEYEIADTDANVGLFGITGEGAVIKDLTITNVDIDTNGRNVGALAGFTYKTTLDNITVNGDIDIRGGCNVAGAFAMSRHSDMSAKNITVAGNDGSVIKGYNIVGGITAEIAPNGSNQTFENFSVENVTIEGISGIGGIVGLLTNGAISDVSVKNAAIIGKTTWKEDENRIRLGSVVGLLGSGGTNCSTVANAVVENVTGKNLEGEAVVLPVVGANFSGSVGNATEARIGDDYYARLTSAFKVAQPGDTVTLLADIAEEVTIPEGVIFDANGFSYIVTGLKGEGTEEKPYLINNKSELKWFRDNVDKQAADGSTQYAGKYIKLTADIDLAGENWNPIGSMSGDHGSFKGVFDGDGHTISNLNVQTNGQGLGLFARTTGNAVIKNLTLNNVTVKSTDNSNYVGGLVGNSYASTKIENVHITGDIDISGRGYIGGISGHGYVVMDNVSVIGEGTISSTFWCAGGILGYAGEGSTNIMNATVEGTGEGLVVTSAAGGLGAIVGMAEDNNGTQPISGSNLSAKNVTIKTYTGAYGDAYANYALGYLYGGNPTSILTGSLVVEDVNIETSTGEKPEVNDAVAKIGNSVYFDLTTAFKAATSGCVIELLADATISDKWDCRYNGAKFLVPVTIEGNNKTIKLTGEVSDMNWNTVFRFEDNATVRNLTIDASEATGIQRGISSKYNITVEGCTLIGNGTSAKRAIIFGEGAGSAISDVTATVTGSTFKGWSYGVSDNQSGKDAKSVSITGSKFENSSVLVSASETVTFTGNEVESGYVNISSYSVPNELSVTAKENILDTTETYAEDNTIKAKTIDAQDGFNTPVAIVAGKYYTDLQSAIDKANGSTITIVDDMTLVDTTYTIADGMAITLDLNGKKITVTENKAEQNSKGNYELFYNHGELTVVGNGSIELTATVNRGWNAMSTIFHNRGGVLTIEDGTFTHNGGTDMAYVVDNSANYSPDTTTNIEGGSLSSTYIAIRNRMDKHTSNGGGSGTPILNVSGGSIYGYKRGIWGQASSTPCTGNITITGGKITSVQQASVLVDEDTASKIDTAISGGIFSSDVSAFLVDGASISKNNDGTYGVVAERTIEVSASEEEVVAGQEFTVTVKLAKGENIFNAEWTLAYDTSLFELKGAAQTGSIKEILSKTLEGQFYAEGEVLKTYTFVAKAVPAKITGSFTLSDTTASTFAESRDAVQVAATNNEKVDVTIKMIEYNVTATLNGDPVDLTATTPVAETTYTGEAQEFIVSTNLPADVDYDITYTVDGEAVNEVALTNVGEYVVGYTITTADGYAEKTGTVTIKVKAPEFVVEATKWTNMGKKLVLVYTNQDAMYFTYDGKLMIDVTSKGYLYNNTEYSHVFAFVTDELANDTVDGYKEKVMYISEDEGLFILTDGHSKADVNFSNTLNVQDISVEYGIVNLHSEIYGDVKYQKHLLKGDTNSDKIVNGKDTAYVVSEVKTAMGIN